MATKSIAELTEAATLTGTEVVPIVQNSITVQTTSQAIAGLTTKTTLGLSNVNNTSDANKPISTATQTALNGKLATTGGTLTGKLTISSGGLDVTGAATISSTLKVTGNISGSATPVDTMTSGFVYIPFLNNGPSAPFTQLPIPTAIPGYAPMYLMKGSPGTALFIYDGSDWKRVLLT
jgi:hypothetical protein